MDSRLAPGRPGIRALPGAFFLAALTAAACSAPSAVVGGEVRLERVLGGVRFERPVHLAQVPDGSGDLVVVEQEGVIRRVFPQGNAAPRLFIDLRDRVSDGGEMGLLSIAFHPRYGENRRFFVYYTAGGPRRSVVARFRAGAGGEAGDPATQAVLLEVGQPYANHNGGQLAFGPDGMLYLGLGDGGSGGDPYGNGQNRKTLLGALLRLDIDRQDPGLAYAIPPDNPFAGARDGSRPEIWAYGLRNPWRFSFDRATGALFLADVGQDAVEEVDRIRKGGNYGWNVMEGDRCYQPPAGCNPAGLELPIAVYTHAEGRSITGGFVYRGKAIPSLVGRYVFADYVRGALWSIPAAGEGQRRPELLLSTSLSISSFGEDAAGELYVLDHGGGGVHKLLPSR